MGRSKAIKNINKFQAAVEYVSEYSGVKGAAIADTEGLVIARSGSIEFDAEAFCPIALEVIAALDKILPRLIKPGVEFLAIKTNEDWMTLAYSKPFLLVVAANREATDLLNIRIGRALEMISSHYKNKYPKTFSTGISGVKGKNMEAVHV